MYVELPNKAIPVLFPMLPFTDILSAVLMRPGKGTKAVHFSTLEGTNVLVFSTVPDVNCEAVLFAIFPLSLVGAFIGMVAAKSVSLVVLPGSFVLFVFRVFACAFYDSLDEEALVELPHFVAAGGCDSDSESLALSVGKLTFIISIMF